MAAMAADANLSLAAQDAVRREAESLSSLAASHTGNARHRRDLAALSVARTQHGVGADAGGDAADPLIDVDTQVAVLRADCRALYENIASVQADIARYGGDGGGAADEDFSGVSERLRVLVGRERAFRADNKRQRKVRVSERDHMDVVQLRAELSAAVDSLRRCEVSLRQKLAKEKKALATQTAINAELKTIHAALTAKVNDPAASQDVGAQLEATLKETTRLNKEYITLLSRFMEQHYPTANAQEENRDARGAGRKRKRSDGPKPTHRSFKIMVQDLLNVLVRRPDNPYLVATEDTCWPPYVELLVRAGLAEKHPTDSRMLRLVAFHI